MFKLWQRLIKTLQGCGVLALGQATEHPQERNSTVSKREQTSTHQHVIEAQHTFCQHIRDSQPMRSKGCFGKLKQRQITTAIGDPVVETPLSIQCPRANMAGESTVAAVGTVSQPGHARFNLPQHWRQVERGSLASPAAQRRAKPDCHSLPHLSILDQVIAIVRPLGHHRSQSCPAPDAPGVQVRGLSYVEKRLCRKALPRVGSQAPSRISLPQPAGITVGLALRASATDQHLAILTPDDRLAGVEYQTGWRIIQPEPVAAGCWLPQREWLSAQYMPTGGSGQYQMAAGI